MGIAGQLEMRDEDAMDRLLTMDYFRGKHSTGLAAVRNTGEVKIAKINADPITLFDMGRYKDARHGASSCVFLGHNRAATRGAVTVNNAHPFRFEHIVGAHNGTLYPSSHTALEKAVGEKYEVDSQAVIAAIAALGIEEALKLMEGSYAISYVDLRNGTINFIRNKDRPLWYATSDKILYWASEWPIIQGGCWGEYRKLHRDKDHAAFFAFQEDIHYSFDIDAIRRGAANEKPKARAKKMEGKGRFLGIGSNDSVGVHNRSSDPFKREGNISNLPARRETTSTTTSPSEVTILHESGTDKDPLAGRISREDYEEMAKGGCNFCFDPVPYGTTGIVIYEQDKKILCPKHSGNVTNNSIRIYTPRLAA